MAAGTSRVCEVEDCGILAVGRCRVCHRTFCQSHQGIYEIRQPLGFVDIERDSSKCSLCAASEVRRQIDAETIKRQHQTDEGRAHRTALEERIRQLLRQLQSMRIGPTPQMQEVVRKTLLGSFKHSKIETGAKGWPVGTLSWRATKMEGPTRNPGGEHALERALLTGDEMFLVDVLPRQGPGTEGYVTRNADGPVKLVTIEMSLADVLTRDLEEVIRNLESLVRSGNP